MVVAVVAMVLAPLASSSARGAPRSRTARGLKRAPAPVGSLAGPAVSVSVDPGAVIGPRVPEDFLGLSFEASNLPDVARFASRGDLVKLLRSLGQGVIRFGGISADQDTAWLQEGLKPGWARTTIGPRDLAGLADLAAATGWRMLLTVNLGHPEPAAAA